MAITDELREYAQIAFDKGSAGRARVETIADSIEDAAHEEAKRIAKMAFDGGIEYERTCRLYNCDAKAYNWEGWLKSHVALFQPKPTVQSVLREFADEVQRCCDTQDTIAEFAAKLRLAGDGE